jgi:oligopeptide/dipeptide ABC transporter ATP-binding protein
MDAVPVPDPARARRPPPVAGETASTLEPPPGCTFHPRCPFAVEVCQERQPLIEPIGNNRVACHRAARLDLSGPDSDK